MAQLSPIGRIERVLLATDGSEFSAGAERVAIAMARQGGVRLAVMTAVLASDDLGETRVRLEAEAVATLDRVAAAAAAEGVEAAKVIRFGDDPYREIVAEATEGRADLVVVGRRGKRGLARLMLGNATVKVIANAPCSVMVVPKATGMWSRRILLATDGSRSSDAAAVLAGRIAQCCKTPVSVLSVEVPSHAPERQAEARPIVERVASLLGLEGIEVEARIGRGLPHDVVLGTAAEIGADLIVMGSHGRTGLGRLLLGSNSEKVIGKATCPVLVAKG